MRPQGAKKVNKMSVPAALERIVASVPDIVGGEPCFIGTRVPLETVVDNLAAGHTIDEILENYPALRSEHVEAVLRWEGDLAREAAGLATRVS